jgi:hypothetical protein
LDLIAPPIWRDHEVFGQLFTIARRAQALGCKTIAIEDRYIDRDHIEDHSIFYSKSLHSYSNHCRRVHFFSADLADLAARLDGAVAEGIKDGEEATRRRCHDLSQNDYLGFTVIRPLSGSPIGRAVLRYVKDNKFREFVCHRPYTVHLGAVELHVDGLAKTLASSCSVIRSSDACSLRGEQRIRKRPLAITSTSSDRSPNRENGVSLSERNRYASSNKKQLP